MSMTISMKKDELVARLQEQVKKAKAEDAKAAKAHEADEQKALKLFRQKLKDAATWDWRTVKQRSYTVGLSNGRYSGPSEVPSCPQSEAGTLERVLKMVQLDSRSSSFSVSKGSDIFEALAWLPKSERPKASMCD